MWCLSELALMLGSCAGPPRRGLSAGTGGTGTRWRKAHQGKQHVSRLHLPHRSRQPQEEAAWKACAISRESWQLHLALLQRSSPRSCRGWPEQGLWVVCQEQERRRSREGGGVGGMGGIHVPHAAKFPLQGGNSCFSNCSGPGEGWCI